MEPEEVLEGPPEGYICMLDFDRLYSKGLLHLSKYPQEERFQKLRLPVIGLSVGWCALQCVLSYRLWRYIRKRLGWLCAGVGVAGLILGSAALWYYNSHVREYFRLEWALTQKYRPLIYNS